MRIVPREVVGGHGRGIVPPAFSPDGARFVAGDGEGWLVARIRGSHGFQEIARLQVPAAGPYSEPQVRAVAWPTPELVVTHEYGAARIRLAGAGLAAAQEQPHLGTGKIAAGGGSTWVAVLADRSVYVLDLPSLNYRAVASLDREGYEYFNVGALAADPDGTLLAVSDDGGVDETSMGVRTAVGTPQVTVVDALRGEAAAAIEVGSHVGDLAWDRWRGRILAATYGDVGVWTPAGECLRRFRPYDDTRATALAVTERWVGTVSGHGFPGVTIDLWNPETFEPLASVPAPDGIPPTWIVGSPDGRTFLTPRAPRNGDFGIQVWSVEG